MEEDEEGSFEPVTPSFVRQVKRPASFKGESGKETKRSRKEEGGVTEEEEGSEGEPRRGRRCSTSARGGRLPTRLHPRRGKKEPKLAITEEEEREEERREDNPRSSFIHTGEVATLCEEGDEEVSLSAGEDRVSGGEEEIEEIRRIGEPGPFRSGASGDEAEEDEPPNDSRPSSKPGSFTNPTSKGKALVTPRTLFAKGDLKDRLGPMVDLEKHPVGPPMTGLLPELKEKGKTRITSASLIPCPGPSSSSYGQSEELDFEKMTL